MKECKRFSFKMREFVHGDLDQDDRVEIEKHLEICEGCRKLCEEELKVKDMLKDLSRVERSSFKSSRGEIMGKIDKNRYGKGLWKRILFSFSGSGLKHAVNALVIVAIVVTGVMVVRNGSFNPANQGQIEVKTGEVSAEMDKAISEYLLAKAGSGPVPADAWFESHQILGTQDYKSPQDGDAGMTKVYLYTEYIGFKIDGKSFRHAAGASNPASIIVTRNKDKYTVSSYGQPGDGQNYLREVKQMFPQDVQEKILEDAALKLELQNDINKQAIAWLKTQGKETLTIEDNYYFFEIPSSIKVYKQGKEFTITKGSPLFNEILYITRIRFEYGKLGSYRLDASSYSKYIAKEDVVLAFSYSQTKETTYRLSSGGVFKGSYSIIYMPLKGEKSDYVIFNNGERGSGVLGELKYSKELLDLVNNLGTAQSQGISSK